MADSRRSARAETPRAAADAVVAAVARALAPFAGRDRPVAVALSGGRDSVALLTAAVRVAGDLRVRVVAIHVHHGISAKAEDWVAFCATYAASLGARLLTRRVVVEAKDALGVEAAARRARYAALGEAAREAGADAILLAHHQDDQAETLLLQLARGAGPHGLAAMPPAQRDDNGLVWLRPLLDLPRAQIESFVRHHGLRYVDDDSNASVRHRRNALRQRIVPALAQTFPGYPATIARVAAHQAEAARLLDELAALDADALVADGTLDAAGLARLEPHRARNLLRHFLRLHRLRAPSTARLAAMLGQLAAPRADAHVRVLHDSAELGVFRGRIVVHRAMPAPFEQDWHGEPLVALPHGQLAFVPTLGEGVDLAALAEKRVVIRGRSGGERLQLETTRPRRALKAWLQEAALPAWERQSLPLLFCDDQLAAVAGLGVDVAFRAAPGMPGVALDWQPRR